MEKVRFLRITYNISKEDLNKIKKNAKTLYICTHDYNPFDIYGTFSIANKCKDHKFYHIAGSNISTKICKKITDYVSNSTVILIDKDTIKKAVDQLNNNHNVFIYLFRTTTGKGIYHIKKQTNCKIVFFKISSSSNSTIKRISLTKLNNKITKLNNKIGLDWGEGINLKGQLFYGGFSPKLDVKLQNIDKLPDNIEELKKMLFSDIENKDDIINL